MQVRYRDIVGKQVVYADGSHAGRVATMLAEQRGDALCVTALIVGTAGWLERFGWGGNGARHIPWTSVERIEGQVYVDVNRDDVDVMESRNR